MLTEKDSHLDACSDYDEEDDGDAEFADEQKLDCAENDENSDNDTDQEHQHQSTQNIDSAQALFIPIAASISLLLMFFFFDSIQTAFVICTSGNTLNYKI